MRDSDESISPSSRNAFTPEFLQRIGERDEPLTAAEADVAGPWAVEKMPGVGWGLFRAGEGAVRQFRPIGVSSATAPWPCCSRPCCPARAGTARSG
jgi:hypothetical protein